MRFASVCDLVDDDEEPDPYVANGLVRSSAVRPRTVDLGPVAT